MYLEIITPDKEIFVGEVKSVTVPGSAGSFEVLDNHAALVSTLEEGKVRIVTQSGEEIFVNLTGGVVEVQKNKVVVLATLN